MKTISFAILLSFIPILLFAQTSAEDRLNSWARHQQMEQDSPYKNIEWKTTGPMKQGGRIESIACPENDPSTIYVGVGSGNLWKTVNNGATWKPIFDQESSFSIGAVAVAPSNPDIVWVGTGEILMARSSYSGTGVFKSTDAGISWENMGLPESHHIGRVLIDPIDPNIVYVAALGHSFTYNEERGLYKTTDGGKTWRKILYSSEKAGCVDVFMDPMDNQSLFAIMWERDRKAWGHIQKGPGSGMFKSTDAGQNWKKVTGGLPGGPDIGRMGMAITATNPQIMYAIVDNKTPMSIESGSKKTVGGEIYRSEDKGETWIKTNKERIPTAINSDYCLIRVSPDNPDQLYVLGNKLLRSDDGAESFYEILGTLVHVQPHQSPVLHLDHHEMWIDPLNSNRVLLGNDGGFHISWDRCETWLHMNNIPIAECYAVTVDMAEPFNIYIGTQDDAALFGPSDQTIKADAEDPWTQIYTDQWGGGDSYFTFVDPNDPNIIYYEHQFGDLVRKDMSTKEIKWIKPQRKLKLKNFKTNWMTPFFISHYDSNTLYYGGNYLFKSTDRGDNWICISPDLSTSPGPEKQGNVPYGTITTLSESLLQQGLIYAGTDDGNIHITRDDGKSWHLINKNLPAKWCSRVVASQHQKNRVYVSFTGFREDDFTTYVYKSDDQGNTWQSIKSNLPEEMVNVIREDPINPDILYLGTDLGVYVSTDQGKNWHSLCNNLPTTPVYDLVIHPRDQKLVIGTHGRSTFVLDTSTL